MPRDDAFAPPTQAPFPPMPQQRSPQQHAGALRSRSCLASLTRFRTSWRRVLAPLLPQHCLLCGTTSGQQPLCALCHQELPWLDAAHCCPQCAQPDLPSGTACGRCLQEPPPYHRVRALWYYRWPIDHLIPAWKYQGRVGLTPWLARTLAAHLHAQQATVENRSDHPCGPCWLVPMPLHPARQRERGFNQSLELARRLARALRLPLHADALCRLRDTPHQAGLDRSARHTNMRAAFSASSTVRDHHIVLIDDVMTSGASLAAAACALRAAGAAEIECWVLARTEG